MIPMDMAAMAERMARIEQKLDALLAALGDEHEVKPNELATLDDGPLDLDSDWSQTL